MFRQHTNIKGDTEGGCGIRDAQQLFIALQALGGRATDDRSNGTPLGRHQLRQVQQLLVLLPSPFCFLDGGVQPFVPPRLALLGRLAH